MMWFINVSIIKINHTDTEEYERTIVYHKVCSHTQSDDDDSELGIIIETIEIYLCTECEPWHVANIVHK